MDSIKGAIVLRERFDQWRRGPEPPAVGAAAKEDSLPLFHWVSNEPRPLAADSNRAA
jgi:hypothetical protein